MSNGFPLAWAPPTVPAVAGPLATALWLGGLGVIHGLLAWLGYQIGAGPFNISPIWPAAGFGLAAICLAGYRVLPFLLLAELTTALLTGSTWPVAGIITLAGLSGQTLGAVLVRRYVRLGSPTADAQDMWRFLLGGGIAAPAVSALIGTAGLGLVGGQAPGSWPILLLTWLTGDAVGILTVTPVIFAWLQPSRRRPALDRPLEGLGLLVLITAASTAAFWQETFLSRSAIQAEYIVLPFLTTAAIRFGLVGAATGNLILALAAISAALARVGPYGVTTPLAFLGLEGMLILTAGTMLMLGMVVTRKAVAIEEARETARLQKSLRELNDMIDQPYIGMMLVDRQGMIQFANTAAEDLLGKHPDELLGTHLGVPLVADQKTDIQIRGREGPGEAEITVHPIQWEGETVYLVSLHDVTERNRAERAVRHQAYHDELTNLPNRTQFEENLERAIHRAQGANRGFALVFLDLDRFKEINDTLGHAAGDEMLRIMAQRLQEGIRAEDMVARMSGDEFIILLTDIDDRDTALRVAGKLRERLFTPMMLRGQTLTPRGTMGLSLFPEDGEEVETLIMRADTAMYAAKEAGRNRIHAYRPHHGAMASRRFKMEQALRRAQENGELQLAYQPQVEASSGRWVGVEALLRWHSPEQGPVAPADFIPVLEETGMIQDVGEWVLRQAHADLAMWDAAGAGIPRVWVNVAAQQLAAWDLVTRLEQLVEEEGLIPERFGLELTETGVAGNVEHSAEILGVLRERGFHLAMDDFGTGYSALYFLRRLPFDTVKIDKAFVQDINKDPKDHKLIRAIITMAHGLEMTPLAEGVETESQAHTLRAEGCDLLQGYLLARPMPADQVPASRKAALN